jgi:hypothetical protein
MEVLNVRPPFQKNKIKIQIVAVKFLALLPRVRNCKPETGYSSCDLFFAASKDNLFFIFQRFNPILIQLNLFYPFKPNFLKTHFNILLPSTLISPK